MTAVRGATAESGASAGSGTSAESGASAGLGPWPAPGSPPAGGLVDEHLRADPGTPARAAGPGPGRGRGDGAGGGDVGRTAWGPADCADVLWLGSSPPLSRAAARRRVRSLLARYPGCLVAAVPMAGGCLVGLRSGAVLLLLARDPAQAAPVAAGGDGVPAPPWGELASVVHAWLVARLPVAALHRAVLRTPAGTVEVRLPADG